MNKKLTVILAVIAAALVLLVGYNAFIAPKAMEGEKQVTIEVVNEDVDESYTYDTNQDFLFDLMEEHKDELGFDYETGELGHMITTMGGYKADDAKQEYYHITINGVDATTGVSEIPLNDGDIYKFEIVNY